MITKELQKKIDNSIRLLKATCGDDVVEVAYSGGKDSDVILQLAKEAGIKYRAIYKNTTIDPPGTIKHCMEMGAEIVQPKKTFAEIVQESGAPNRFRRICCDKLKEYKILDKAIMGIRKDESTKRNKRYQEPTECRFFGSKKNHVNAIYPILDWTLEDVVEFLTDRKIKCAPAYYDEQGNFHPERRLGCMCCPLASRNNRINFFKEKPKMVRFYLRNMKIYLDTHKDSRAYEINDGNPYCWFVRDVFYNDNNEGWKAVNNGLFEKPNYKQFLEDYFKINLDV